MFDRSWHYQIGNAARDLFFITPFIILIAKLIMSQPSQSRFHNAIVLAICVWGVLTGHSLGLVYITPIIATVIIFKFLEFKKKLVGILEIWIVGGGLIISGFATVKRYFFVQDPKLGFVFPYYEKDPALKAFWSENKFMTNNTIGDYINFIYVNATSTVAITIICVAIACICISGLLIKGKVFQKSKLQNRFIELIMLFITLNAAILFNPIRFDGLSLLTSFSSNRAIVLA